MVTPFERALMKVGELVLVADIQNEQLMELGQKLEDAETTVAELEGELEDLREDDLGDVCAECGHSGGGHYAECSLYPEDDEVDEDVDAASDAA